MNHVKHVFGDDGDIPNNRLPLIVYPGIVDAAAGDAALTGTISASHPARKDC